MRAINIKKSKVKISAALLSRCVLLAATFCVIMLVVYLGTRVYVGNLYEGDIALKDVYAPNDFTYSSELDETKTSQLKQEAASSVRPFYRMDPEAVKRMKDELSLFINEVSRQMNLQVDETDKINAIKSVSGSKINDNMISAFLKRAASSQELLQKTPLLLDVILQKPIIDEQINKKLVSSKAARVTLHNPDINREIIMPVEDMLFADSLSRQITKLSHAVFPKDRELRQAAIDAVKSYIQPNIKEDPDAYKRLVEEAMDNAGSVYQQIPVKRNEIIVTKGQRMTKKEKAIFEYLNKLQAEKNRISFLTGIAILLLLVLGVGITYMKLYEPQIFYSTKDMFLISVLFASGVAAVQILTLSGFSTYIVPLASISMLIAILLTPNIAFVATVILSILAGAVAGGKIDMAIMILIGGSVGIYFVKSVRKRADIIKAGFFVGVANFLSLSASGFLNNLAANVFLVDAYIGLVNGVISSFIVMGLLPFFESIFKITTDVTLLELSDLNHPLLREMVVKAPGTYHHSILVGNLAEAACNAIGANSLLARVGAYYHDIGKMDKPEYFNENEYEFKSRHKDLSPSMSALIIINHIKDGAELAKRYKISDKIINFILQHHGTGLVYYFYQRAVEHAKSKENTHIDESVFRYLGPKPQTKEAAIVLLADSVEAASRTLSDPTPAKIKAFVQRMINNKFVDGQLDECDLTLRDLNRIAESFQAILIGMFHKRTGYVIKDDEKRDNIGKVP